MYEASGLVKGIYQGSFVFHYVQFGQGIVDLVRIPPQRLDDLVHSGGSKKAECHVPLGEKGDEGEKGQNGTGLGFGGQKGTGSILFGSRVACSSESFDLLAYLVIAKGLECWAIAHGTGKEAGQVRLLTLREESEPVPLSLSAFFALSLPLSLPKFCGRPDIRCFLRLDLVRKSRGSSTLAICHGLDVSKAIEREEGKK